MRIALVRVARTAFVVETFADVLVALVPATFRIVGQIAWRFAHGSLLSTSQRAADRVSSRRLRSVDLPVPRHAPTPAHATVPLNL